MPNPKSACQQERSEAGKILAKLAYYEMANPYSPKSPEPAIQEAKQALHTLLKERIEGEKIKPEFKSADKSRDDEIFNAGLNKALEVLGEVLEIQSHRKTEREAESDSKN